MNSEDLNKDERALVRSTAFAVLRNGAAFFEWLRVKRQADPSYAFLYGGAGSEYYKWCLANNEEAEKEDKAESLAEKSSIIRKPVGAIPSVNSKRDDDSGSRRNRSRSGSYSRYRSRSLDRGRRESPVRRHRRQSPVRPRRRSPARRSPRRPNADIRRSSPQRRHSPPKRSTNEDTKRSKPDHGRSRSPWGKPKPARRSDDAPAGKMYAWSDDEQPSNVLRQKLAAMKQKLIAP